MLEAAHFLLEVDRDLFKEALLGIEDHGVDARNRGTSCLGGLHALLLNDSGLQDIDAGLDHVELDEFAVLLLLALDLVERSAVNSGHVTDAAEPVLDESKILSLQRS